MKHIAIKLAKSHDNPFANLLMRLTLGVIFIGHGWGKLFAKGNPEGFAAWLGSMGLEPSYLFAVMAGLSETLGGFLLIIGLFTRIAAASLVTTMLVAIFYVHFDAGLFGKGGYEFQLVLLVASLLYLIQGAGRLSIDSWFYIK